MPIAHGRSHCPQALLTEGVKGKRPIRNYTFINKMSSTVPTVSASNFRLIVDAFDDYANRVGEDLTKNPLADALRTCDTPNAVLRLLQERAEAFKHFRDGDRTLIEWLKPVVHVVHGFSNVLGQIASMVSGAPCFISLVTFSTVCY